MSTVEYPVLLEAPDISPYRIGNTGVEYVTTFGSARPGPHVMLTAVVHGNELCGAIALDFLFRNHVRPCRGKLTLAFMNVSAFLAFDPAAPTSSRYVDEDFNRLWSDEILDGPRDSVELRRARAVRPVVAAADVLLDIHSMQHPNPPLMMAGPAAKGRELAGAVGIPAHVVVDAGHAAGPRMRDFGAFIDGNRDRNALLVECGQHWARSSVDVARVVALRLLAHLGMLDAAIAKAHLPESDAPAQRTIEVSGPVTIQTEEFRFASDYRGMELIAQRGSVIGWDGDEAIRTPYDDCVLIMPARRLRKGDSAVRFGRYVS